MRSLLIKLIIPVAAMLVVVGCTHHSKKSAKSIIYHSESNGFAEIKLVLKPDSTFTFFLKIIPQPMEAGHTENIHFSGHWKLDNEWITLQTRDRRIDMGTLFDARFANQHKLISRNKVMVRSDIKRLTIWGIGCTKIEQ